MVAMHVKGKISSDLESAPRELSALASRSRLQTLVSKIDNRPDRLRSGTYACLVDFCVTRLPPFDDSRRVWYPRAGFQMSRERHSDEAVYTGADCC